MDKDRSRVEAESSSSLLLANELGTRLFVRSTG
jgi:hypothetical protein